MQRFDMGQAWTQTVAMIQGNRESLLIIGGLFFFVPTLLWTLMAGPMPEPAPEASLTTAIQQYSDYFKEAAPWIVVASLIGIVGSLTIWRLLLARGGTSVGASLQLALLLFIGYVAASVIVGLATTIGFILFIIPGLYLTARLCLTGAYMAATQSKNPVEAIGASWGLTKHTGWWILLFIIILILVGSILMGILQTVFGGIFALTLPENIANILSMTVDALIGAVFSIVMTVSYAAIYRQAAPETAAELFE